MDWAIDPLVNSLTADAGGRWLTGWALSQFVGFLYILFRVAGLMTVGPLFGNKSIPTTSKALLAGGLALLLTPALTPQSRDAFAKLDTNGDGWVSEAEVPEALLPRFHRRVEAVGNSELKLRPAEWPAPVPIPQHVLDYARTGLSEFAIGLLLGLAATTILSALQLAGEMIDQQTGIALSEIFNPGFQELDGSVTGRFLMLFGTTLFLVMSPVNGHLLLLDSLLETFSMLPVGEAEISLSAIDLLSRLIHASLVLAIQVAAPILAAMSLVALAMGFLGHTVPQLNVFNFGFPVRALVNLAILALTFSGISETVVEALVETMTSMRFALLGQP